jgi:hypothetical protein
MSKKQSFCTRPYSVASDFGKTLRQRNEEIIQNVEDQIASHERSTEAAAAMDVEGFGG